MEMLLSLILGPLGKILGIIVAVGGAILYGKYYKAKAEKAQADGYQAQVEIAQGCEEVRHEVEKVVEETRQKVEPGDAAGLADSFELVGLKPSGESKARLPRPTAGLSCGDMKLFLEPRGSLLTHYLAFVPLIGAPHFSHAVVLKGSTQLSLPHLPHFIFSFAII